MDASRLIVAVDKIGPARKTLTAMSELCYLAEQLLPLGVGIKVRPSHFYTFGHQVLASVGFKGPRLFVDAKLHDTGDSCLDDLEIFIQSLNPGLITCHLEGSNNMLEKLGNRCAGTSTGLVGVTILSDITPEECRRRHGYIPVTKANRQIRDGREHGRIMRTVCAPQEVAMLKPSFPGQIFITPSVRPAGSSLDDQARADTPTNTILKGADYLVVGRPITCATNPREAAQTILGEMEEAFSQRAKPAL